MRQLVCRDCGWKGELDPDGTMYCGPGGTLSCPACREAKRNGPFIEGAYGSVHSVDVPPFKGWKMQHTRRSKFIHYFENGKTACGSHAEASGEYLIKEHWEDGYSKEFLKDLGKQFCPKCEVKLSTNANHEIKQEVQK